MNFDPAAFRRKVEAVLDRHAKAFGIMAGAHALLRRQIASGDAVTVRSNGTSVELRARISAALAAGSVRIAEEHAGDLHRDVEVVKVAP